MFKRTLSLAGAALLLSVFAFGVLPGSQGQVMKKVEVLAEPKGSGDLEHSASRLKKISNSLGLPKPQMEKVGDLWNEFAGKFKEVLDNKTLRADRKEDLFQNLHENYDRRYRNLLTRPQREKLNTILKEIEAKIALAKSKVKEGAKGAESKKTCWSCWPGKCDRIYALSK